MAKMLVLSAQDISQVFTISDALAAVEEAYVQKAQGSAAAWPLVYAAFEPGEADMDIRSGDLAAAGLFGLKLTAWFSRNPERNLPEIYGTTLLASDRTGEPLALLNASAITGLRTGAAGALGVRALARPDSTTLSLVGMGHQCPYQVAAALAAMPQLKTVFLSDPRADGPRAHRAEEIEAQVAALLSKAGIERDVVMEATSVKDAVRQADAVICVTPATTPVLKAEWVRPGTHISAVGADMEGKQELPCDLVAQARLFADDRAQSVASGEFEVPVKQDAIKPDAIVAELGEVLAGAASGRSSDKDITIFDTSGIAIQDLAASKVAYDRAVEANIGTWVEL